MKPFSTICKFALHTYFSGLEVNGRLTVKDVRPD